MAKIKILSAIPDFAPKGKKILSSLGRIDYLKLNQPQLEKIIGQYEILIVGLGLNINNTVINQGKKLKYIATVTTGLDHIDVNYAQKKGIKIISLKGEKKFLREITGTAELAFGLMINLARNIIPGTESLKNYRWERYKFIGHNLSGQTLGIFGFGRLGKLMAQYAQGFNMKIIAYDPYLKTKKKIKGLNYQLVNFKKLISSSDIISIHATLTKETENIFNQKVFSKMKKSALLINTARGKIVNEKDLLIALKQKKISGYATDVLADELLFVKKIKKNSLIEYAKNNSNMIITPHVGGLTYESRLATDIFIAQKIKTILE
ncbi:MAG: NAD(P)-dependent oxidoreductase [Patescibacteria group bacterium]